MGANPPFTLQAQARLSARAGDGVSARAGDGVSASTGDATMADWTAQASANGPLAQFDLRATLRGTALRGGSMAPSLDVDAAITPLQAWPLGRLRLRTQALDLSALASKAPRTALTGRVDIDSRSLAGPVAATVELDNATPGRWDDGRVPLRRLQARLRSPDNKRDRLVIEDFDAQLANAAEAAGRWRGSGQWAGQQLQVDSTLEALRPHLLTAALR